MIRRVIEIAAVVTAAAIPFVPTPLVSMVAVASLALWTGSRGWADVGLRGGDGTWSAIGIGIVGGVVSVVALGLIDPSAVGFGQPVAVRGSLEVAIIAIILVTATAAAAEMVRGFLISALADLANEPVAVVAVAVLWAALFGSWTAGGALGVATASLGFGLLYLAGGRRLALPIALHITHQVGAVIAVYAKIV